MVLLTIKWFHIIISLLLIVSIDAKSGGVLLNLYICFGDCEWWQYMIMALSIVLCLCCCACGAASRMKTEVLRDERDSNV